MKEGIPTPPPKVEIEPVLPDIEGLHQYGNQYQEIIQSVIGNIDAETLNVDSYPQELKRYFEIAVEYKSQQEEMMTEKSMGVRELLSQTSMINEDNKELLADESKYRLEKLSDGIYAVMIDFDLAEKLRPGAAAVAFKGKGKKHFLFIKELKDSKYQKYQENNLRENIPHETHHLVWDAAQDENLFPSTETDPHYRASFRLFQDELVARASSGGALGGYNHIRMLSPDQRQKLEAEMPGHADAIIKRVGGLNGFLSDLGYLFARSAVFTTSDLLQPVITSTSFDELEEKLHQIKTLIEAHPLKEDENDGGWGVVL